MDQAQRPTAAVAEAQRQWLAALQDAPSDQWARIISAAVSEVPGGVEALHEAALSTIPDPDEREWLRQCLDKVDAA